MNTNEKAKITRLCTISSNSEWYVIYNDSDSMTDYFHSRSGSQKRITEYVKEDGANIIEVTLQNGNEVKEKDIKGLHRLAKKTGYTFELIEKEVIRFDGNKGINKYGVLKRSEVLNEI